MSKITTILREAQYEKVKSLTLNGKVLDLGGSRKSGYQKLIKGSPEFTVVNISEEYGYDIKFNIEEKFPLENESFDNALSMNLIEHIFDTHNLFSETSRVLKQGGLFVSAVPYMHHIHGSPDDFVRYTDSAYRKLADKYGFKVVEIECLGKGVFSLFFQSLPFFKLPWFIYNILKVISVSIDTVLCNISYYKKIAENIPLGYFLILEKK